MITPSLNLLVLYVTDLEASVRFYTACGLNFEKERHGTGPLHYSSTAPSGLVIEIYPRGTRQPTRTRLGFAAEDTATLVADLAAAGWPDVSAPRDLDYGRVRLVRDPDGNAVELVELPVGTAVGS